MKVSQIKIPGDIIRTVGILNLGPYAGYIRTLPLSPKTGGSFLGEGFHKPYTHSNRLQNLKSAGQKFNYILHFRQLLFLHTVSLI